MGLETTLGQCTCISFAALKGVHEADLQTTLGTPANQCSIIHNCRHQFTWTWTCTDITVQAHCWACLMQFIGVCTVKLPRHTLHMYKEILYYWADLHYTMPAGENIDTATKKATCTLVTPTHSPFLWDWTSSHAHMHPPANGPAECWTLTLSSGRIPDELS